MTDEILGIDLGTTNSALAWIDEREAEDRDFPPLHIFETPQVVLLLIRMVSSFCLSMRC